MAPKFVRCKECETVLFEIAGMKVLPQSLTCINVVVKCRNKKCRAMNDIDLLAYDNPTGETISPVQLKEKLDKK